MFDVLVHALISETEMTGAGIDIISNSLTKWLYATVTVMREFKLGTGFTVKKNMHIYNTMCKQQYSI